MKVALVAMSGVRACNEELTRLGFTLPGFVERSRVIASLPSLSLLTLAGMTPDRFELSYHEVADIADAELPECDLAAISTYTAQAKDAYELARRFRERGIATVIGGLHVTALPDEAASHVDAVVTGEGELSWLQVLADFEAGRLASRYGPDGCEFDLGGAPLPRFDLLEPERYNRLTVQTSRGCPWRCEFCASSILLTPRYKLKPVVKVLDEIREIKSIWKHPFVEFADDNSFVDKRRARELVEALAEEGGVRWFTETDVSVADDEELLTLMHESGCMEVLIGFESPTEAALDRLETRSNWKRRRFDSYRAAVERIQAHGIAVNGCFVLGLDGGTTSDFDAIRRFVEDSGLFDVQITVLTPFPGTPLYARLLREERLLDPVAWEKCTLFDVNFRPRQMSVDELERGLVELGSQLYSQEAKDARHRRFATAARRAPRRRKEVMAGAN